MDFKLSPAEFSLVRDDSWIFSKNLILQKAVALMSGLQARLQELDSLQHFPYYPEPTLNNGPKISKGENYRGLPFVILDYPRHFSKESVFALRTMFWWGNFFSCTLHAAGKTKQILYPSLLQAAYRRASGTAWQICRNTDQWEHHMEPDNYIPLAQMELPSLQEIAGRQPFFKLSLIIPLDRWDEVPNLAVEQYNDLLNELASGDPDGISSLSGGTIL